MEQLEIKIMLEGFGWGATASTALAQAFVKLEPGLQSRMISFARKVKEKDFMTDSPLAITDSFLHIMNGALARRVEFVMILPPEINWIKSGDIRVRDFEVQSELNDKRVHLFLVLNNLAKTYGFPANPVIYFFDQFVGSSIPAAQGWQEHLNSQYLDLASRYPSIDWRLTSKWELSKFYEQAYINMSENYWQKVNLATHNWVTNNQVERYARRKIRFTGEQAHEETMRMIIISACHGKMLATNHPHAVIISPRIPKADEFYRILVEKKDIPTWYTLPKVLRYGLLW